MAGEWEELPIPLVITGRSANRWMMLPELAARAWLLRARVAQP
jgi:hypothetical protein